MSLSASVLKLEDKVVAVVVAAAATAAAAAGVIPGAVAVSRSSRLLNAVPPEELL